MPEKTTRQVIIDLLRDGEYTVRELTSAVELPLSRVVLELEHVARSRKKELKMRPASCQACSFVFKKRTRFTTPSRCPKCRSERTEGPFVRLERADSL
jgi:predicted Zn-ribbon and HTH transcriptional regulator